MNDRQKYLAGMIARRIGEAEYKFCLAIGYDRVDANLLAWAQYDDAMRMMKYPAPNVYVGLGLKHVYNRRTK